MKDVIEYETIKGIYFLMNKKEVVYVGQSIDIVQRVHSHRFPTGTSSGILKEFTHAKYKPYDYDKETRENLELKFIKRLKPIYNINGNPDCLGENGGYAFKNNKKIIMLKEKLNE